MRLLLALFVLLPTFMFAQIVNRSEVNLTDSSNFSGFELLDDKFKENKIIISGENHTYREDNLNFLFKLFKYGHQNHDVNTIIFEFGLGFEFIAQKFVYEKDSVASEFVNKRLYFEQSQLLKKLQTYYYSLSDSNKFFIESVDIDRNWSSTFKALTIMTKKDSVPEDLVFFVESIEAMSDYYLGQYIDISPTRSYSTVDAQNSVKDILDNYEIVKAELVVFLEDDFEKFDAIILNLNKGWKWYQYSIDNMVQEGVYREQEMYKNMLSLIDTRTDVKAVGQFGRCHIKMGESSLTHCYNVNIKSFTKRLERSSKYNLEDSVFVMPILYKQNFSNAQDGSFISYFDGLNNTPKEDRVGLHIVQFDKSSLDTINEFKLNTEFAMFQYNGNHNSLNEIDRKRDGLGEKRDYYEYFHFEGGVAYHKFDFDAINDNLNTLGYNLLNKNTFGYSGSFTYYEPLYVYFSTDFTYFKQQSFSNASNKSVDFDGWQIKMNYGFPCIDNKHLQLAFYSGAGFGKFKIEESNLGFIPFLTPSSVVQLTQNTSKIQSTNPGLLLDVGTDFRVKIFPLSLWAKGGYQFDVSSRKWKSQINSTIKTSHSSFYLKAGASIYFGMN